MPRPMTICAAHIQVKERVQYMIMKCLAVDLSLCLAPLAVYKAPLHVLQNSERSIRESMEHIVDHI